MSRGEGFRDLGETWGILGRIGDCQVMHLLQEGYRTISGWGSDFCTSRRNFRI